MKRKVIAWVGYPASGKSEASRVAASMGIPVVVMGDIVRKEARRRGFKEEDVSIGAVAEDLRKNEGMDAIAKRSIPCIMKKEGVVVVDGVRGIAEVDRFRAEFGNDFFLVAILSPFKLRFERMQKRGRGDDGLTEAAFKARDLREEGWGLRDAIEASDIVIQNEGDLDAFSKEVYQVLMEMITDE
ncbi:MAG: dephospho-CoA kinase [Candidatus Syntrophoarchaeum caldarius]|uniref:UPF0200 protein SCAL_000696 n=1 Tax=Candidatus Syntropharchaeum caldarium TaxID=1838285 RepID=A0A1F2PBP4_9EURY|nr:MAG: dephospho-CoA kinase [Candidatus Syntrophoarchaeum caldarius]